MRPSRRTRWSVIALVAAVGLVAYQLATATDHKDASTAAAVPWGAKPEPTAFLTGPAEVIDGDTLRVKGQQVRLLGMDAPELDQPCYDADGNEWSCGQEAKAHLEAMIGDAEVMCRGYDVDEDRSILAVCTKIPEGREPIDLGERQVLAGWAVAYGISDVVGYIAAEDYAADHSKGLWSATGRLELPDEWRSRWSQR